LRACSKWISISTIFWEQFVQSSEETWGTFETKHIANNGEYKNKVKTFPTSLQSSLNFYLFLKNVQKEKKNSNLLSKEGIQQVIINMQKDVHIMKEFPKLRKKFKRGKKKKKKKKKKEKEKKKKKKKKKKKNFKNK